MEWPAQYEDIHTGAYDFNDRGPSSKVRAAVHLDAAGVVDLLPWALTDLGRVKVTGLGHFLWIRVLDVERSLAARPWIADGEVVVAVDDRQVHAAGSFAIETADGRARVARTDRPADVALTAETLGSLYLGAVMVAALHRAGRLTGSDDAARRFAAMADLTDPPYNLTGF